MAKNAWIYRKDLDLGDAICKPRVVEASDEAVLTSLISRPLTNWNLQVLAMNDILARGAKSTLALLHYQYYTIIRACRVYYPEGR